jgi:hypothetical protein
MKRMRTVVRGKRTRYAPVTADTAPDAPITGAGLMAMCPSPANTDPARKNTRNPACPKRSSTLGPNTHRKTALEMTCHQSACAKA